MVTTMTRENNQLTKAGEAPELTHDRVVSSVAKQVHGYIERGTLHLPKDYSADNALKEAYCMLPRIDGFFDCTPNSVALALLDMVIWGLNPGKKQVYFIKYGSSLICQRSYKGDIALAIRVDPTLKPYADVVYEGDSLVTHKEHTRFGYNRHINEHEQPFPRKSNLILAAYAGAVHNETGEDMGIELMQWNDILASWRKSKTIKWADANKTEVAPGTFHYDQPDQAAMRTVWRRWAKGIIDTSDDEMLKEAIRRQDVDNVEGEVAEDAAMNANKIVLSLPSANPETTDTETDDVKQGFTEEEKAAIAEQEARENGGQKSGAPF